MKNTDIELTIQEQIGRTLGRVQRNRFQLCEILLERMGIGPGQVPILGELGFHGEMTQRQLAEHTHVTAATISGTLKRMERAGLVYRTDDEKDARVSIVRLTEDGKELGKQASELFAKTDVNMLEGFSDEECAVLLGFLNRMRDNVCSSLSALNDTDKSESGK